MRDFSEELQSHLKEFDKKNRKDIAASDRTDAQHRRFEEEFRMFTEEIKPFLIETRDELLKRNIPAEVFTSPVIGVNAPFGYIGLHTEKRIQADDPGMTRLQKSPTHFLSFSGEAGLIQCYVGGLDDSSYLAKGDWIRDAKLRILDFLIKCYPAR